MRYLVLPYIPGQSLRERLELEKRLSLPEALRLTLEVAEALSYAHSRNVVHRDVKPENILLFQGHAMVVDFGIAKALSDTETDSVTLEGMFVGTPMYMAPEQMFGDQPVDERADIYSLASVLYELLDGITPFHGPSATAIFARKATMAAVAPKNPIDELPPHVEQALLRALESERDRRFASVSEFAEALTTAPSAGRPARRSGAVSLQSIAVLPFANSSAIPENEYLSDGISEDLIHALSKLPSLRVVARTSAFAVKGRSHDVRPIRADPGVSPLLPGSLRRPGDRLRVDLARPTYHRTPIALGINTDAYRRIERRYRITRGLLELLAECRHPVSLITKSALVERDLDLLVPMAQRNLVSVHFSITTLDNQLAAKMEPRATAPHRKLKAMRALHEAGVPVGVMVAPVIPALTDPEMESILEAAHDAGARSAGYVLLRLPHEIKDLFRDWLAQRFPDRAEHVLWTLPEAGQKLHSQQIEEPAQKTADAVLRMTELPLAMMHGKLGDTKPARVGQHRNEAM